MDATLTWLDLTASDRDKMRRVLDLFHEQGTIDEMGLGNLRDAFSDALFPGTSTIQTRLRYVLFIPWMYQRLEARKTNTSDIAVRSRTEEIQLIGPLKQNEDSDGTIGGVAHDSLSRLPSSVYWTALVRWGIFRHQQSQGWYHSNFDRLACGSGDGLLTDDPGVVQAHRPNWHPRLPAPPPSFPADASFALTRDEAEFLRGRLEENCGGTLLAWLAREGSDALHDGGFWDDRAASQASAETRKTIELARRFSLHVEGMPLLYNLLLAERLHSDHGGDEEPVDRYRAEFSEWATREAEEQDYDPASLWAFAASRGARMPAPQHRFVESWSKRIAEIPPTRVTEDQSLRVLIANREQQLKGKRARLVNTGRLLDWNGAVGVGRMDFRWHRVRQLLLDLHQGLSA